MAEYIDRQAVLDELDEDIEEFVECDYALKTAKKYIKKIPPADVRPVVRGHWEAMEPAFIGLSYGICSACRRRLVLLDEIGINFCPHCGAEMIGTDDTKEG